MSNLNLPPLPTSQMFSPDGYMSREWQDFFRLVYNRVKEDVNLEDILSLSTTGMLSPEVERFNQRMDIEGLLVITNTILRKIREIESTQITQPSPPPYDHGMENVILTGIWSV